MRRGAWLVAPVVFWNWCQSPESIYRECLFNAAGGLAQSRVPFANAHTDDVRALCREAADLPRDAEESALFDRQRENPAHAAERLRRAQFEASSKRLDDLTWERAWQERSAEEMALPPEAQLDRILKDAASAASAPSSPSPPERAEDAPPR